MNRAAGLLPIVMLLAACTPEPRPRPADDVPAPMRSGTAHSPAPARIVPEPAGDCPASGVRLELGEVNAAMGLRAQGLELVNCGHESYRLNGVPAIRALDEEHAPLTVRIVRVSEISASITGRNGPPAPVVLRRGERAGATLAWRSTYTGVQRSPVAVPYLEVVPAGGEPAQVVTADIPLDLGSTGRLGVGPWLPVTPGTGRTDGPPDPVSPGRSPAVDEPAAPRRG